MCWWLYPLMTLNCSDVSDEASNCTYIYHSKSLPVWLARGLAFFLLPFLIYCIVFLLLLLRLYSVSVIQVQLIYDKSIWWPFLFTENCCHVKLYVHPRLTYISFQADSHECVWDTWTTTFKNSEILNIWVYFYHVFRTCSGMTVFLMNNGSVSVFVCVSVVIPPIVPCTPTSFLFTVDLHLQDVF